MTETPIDLAFRAQDADPDDPALRLRFHERILDAELLLVLEAEAGDRLAPDVLDLAEGRFVLAFDRDDRLDAFLEAPAHFASLAGRRLVGMLAGKGIGLALNLGAPSAALIPAAGVDWLAEMAAQAPDLMDGRPGGYRRPDVPPALLAALGPKLAAMADAVGSAFLVEANYPDGDRLLIALGGVAEAVRPAVAGAIAEAVRFSGVEGVALDVTFLGPESAGGALERVALRLDLPSREPRGPAGPGMDPGCPPKLR